MQSAEIDKSHIKFKIAVQVVGVLIDAKLYVKEKSEYGEILRWIIVKRFFQPFTPKELTWSDVELKVIGIYWACEYFWSYLYDVKFLIETNDSIMSNIFVHHPFNQLSPRIQIIMSNMRFYKYRVVYRERFDYDDDENAKMTPERIIVVDKYEKLRCSIENAVTMTLNGTTFAVLMLCRNLLNLLQDDTKHTSVLKNYINFRLDAPGYFKWTYLKRYEKYLPGLSVYQNLVFYVNRLWVPEEYREMILNACGETRTAHNAINLIDNFLWWPMMENDLKWARRRNNI